MKTVQAFVRYGRFSCLAALVGCSVYHPLPLSTGAEFMPAPGGGHALALADIGALAVRHDPALVAARAARGVAAAELLAAGRPPDPVISGGFAALLSGPGAMPAISAGLTQDLSALVTYRADRAAAKAGVNQVDAGILWQEWQVAAQAEQLCVSLRADEAILASLDADDAALRAESATVAAEVTAGNLTLADQAAADAALAAVEGARNSAIATRAQDLDQLDSLLDLAPGTALHIAPGAPPAIAPAVAQAALASLPTRRPDLLALRYGYEQADAKLRAAILAQFLPVSLGAAGGRDTSNVVSAGPQLSLTLPLFSHNRPAIEAAMATRAVLRAQYQASLDDATAGVMSLNAALSRLEPEAAQADAAATAAETAAAEARAAFAAGALDARAETDFITTAGERRRTAILLHEQIDTATLSLATLAGIGLPPVTEPRT